MSQMLLQTTVVSRYLREAAALRQWMNPLLSDLSGAEAALTAENFGPRGGFQANAKILLVFIQGIQQHLTRKVSSSCLCLFRLNTEG